MEAAGLGVGVVALMGLLKTCLEVYDTIECGRRYGAAYEVLTTKIGIERVRLILWGDLVGLHGLDLSAGAPVTMSATVDPRLHDPRISKAVCDILNCMRQLFEDAGPMTRRYGLHGSKEKQPASESMRNALVTTFRTTYTRFQEASAQRQEMATVLTTARWAIKDKKRFEGFVEDLRSFNDSLFGLFPDLDSQVRREMVAEIRSSTDLENLQVVEEAVTDMEASEELADAASLRISQLSQRTRSMTVDGADVGGPGRTLETDDGDTTTSGDINAGRVAKQLEKLERHLQTNRRGSLQFTLHAVGGWYFRVFSGWEGAEADKEYAQGIREMEYPGHPYPAWDLMYAPKTPHTQEDWDDYDGEASRKFEGRFAGTRTAEGYAADQCDWAHGKEDRGIEVDWTWLIDLPEPRVPLLLARLRRLQVKRSLPRDEQTIKRDAEALIGPAAFQGIARGDRDVPQTILRLLGHTDHFQDLRVSPCLTSFLFLAHDPMSPFGIPNFLFQMVLAYELKLHMERAGDTVFDGYTSRVAAMVIAAKRWIDGVLVKQPDPTIPKLEFHSLVYERQVEGLLRFAEMMRWPALGETRAYLEEVYPNMHTGASIGLYLWDWLHGTVRPGNLFVFSIICALVQASPGLSVPGPPTYFNLGLVLDDRSYWRSLFVLGRVFGGLRGVKAANGWVGPCPLPVEDDDAKSKIATGWWRVHARNLTFKSPKDWPSDANGDGGAYFAGMAPVAGRTSQAGWIRAAGDQSKWVVPVGPNDAPDTVEFRELRLSRLRNVPATAYIPGFRAAKGHFGTGDDGELLGLGDTDNLNSTQRASVELTINGAPVCFTLHNNPVFVAAPRCIDGPHAVPERDLPKLRHILRVSQLPDKESSDERVLIIDATGRGECELAARAWCAEKGLHAVVRRGPGTCFVCAVMAASPHGLGLGCLIWS